MGLVPALSRCLCTRVGIDESNGYWWLLSRIRLSLFLPVSGSRYLHAGTKGPSLSTTFFQSFTGMCEGCGWCDRCCDTSRMLLCALETETSNARKKGFTHFQQPLSISDSELAKQNIPRDKNVITGASRCAESSWQPQN